MNNRKMILGWSIVILGGFNALLYVLLLNSRNFFEDLVLLPILTMSTIIALFVLNKYCKEEQFLGELAK